MGLPCSPSLFWALKSHLLRSCDFRDQNRLNFQQNPSNAPRNVYAPHKNHKAKHHIIKSLINSYYYTYSNVLEICYMKQMTTIKHRLDFHNFTSGYIDSFDRNYILYILLYTKTLVHLRPFTCLPWKTGGKKVS